jgi:glycosyltransferase involved in cell wall biosynthesis
LKNIRVIYNGIALDRIKPVNGSEKPDTAVNLGISSRIDRIKGHFELLEAFRKFEDPNVRLLIANKGPDLEELKQKVYGYGLDDRVKFTGFFDKIGDFLKQLDIFVQPSRKEPFGLTALEALAAGIPVVASNLIGLDEVVEDNKTGLLFKMMDAHDLHEKLALLVKNPELRQKMGIAARESVKKFDVMNQVRGYESLYTESEETC